MHSVMMENATSMLMLRQEGRQIECTWWWQSNHQR